MGSVKKEVNQIQYLLSDQRKCLWQNYKKGIVNQKIKFLKALCRDFTNDFKSVVRISGQIPWSDISRNIARGSHQTCNQRICFNYQCWQREISSKTFSFRGSWRFETTWAESANIVDKISSAVSCNLKLNNWSKYRRKDENIFEIKKIVNMCLEENIFNIYCDV